VNDELSDRFAVVCKQLAARGGVSLNVLFNNGASYGVTQSWLRDRYYRRIAIRQEDVDRLMAFLITDAASASASKDLSTHREAVRRMCLACDGGDDEEKATCWDNTCPLRPVSPLPYRYTKGRLT